MPGGHEHQYELNWEKLRKEQSFRVSEMTQGTLAHLSESSEARTGVGARVGTGVVGAGVGMGVGDKVGDRVGACIIRLNQNAPPAPRPCLIHGHKTRDKSTAHIPCAPASVAVQLPVKPSHLEPRITYLHE
jgi:hypothetical protein